MVPSGALIFKLEQTFFGLDVDYTQVYELAKIAAHKGTFKDWLVRQGIPK